MSAYKPFDACEIHQLPLSNLLNNHMPSSGLPSKLLPWLN
jgi:hypothetical protein